jgi:hypothetical protein
MSKQPIARRPISRGGLPDQLGNLILGFSHVAMSILTPTSNGTARLRASKGSPRIDTNRILCIPRRKSLNGIWKPVLNSPFASKFGGQRIEGVRPAAQGLVTARRTKRKAQNRPVSAQKIRATSWEFPKRGHFAALLSASDISSSVNRAAARAWNSEFPIDSSRTLCLRYCAGPRDGSVILPRIAKHGLTSPLG